MIGCRRPTISALPQPGGRPAGWIWNDRGAGGSRNFTIAVQEGWSNRPMLAPHEIHVSVAFVGYALPASNNWLVPSYADHLLDQERAPPRADPEIRSAMSKTRPYHRR